MPAAVLAVWLAVALGWGAVLAGMRRGLHGRARGPALLLHGITPWLLLLGFATLGYGSLYAMIALAAEWWALLLVTRLRPERLLDGGARLAALWLAIAAAATLLATRLAV
ncbi:hypothetical protein [Actinomadura parmotrematis]|uniref:hypothetical protein n=1 Tax=Actinomadura parmotrematis TaxID=2864039 RepID=UPI0027E35AA7|nr:hypothetical protein [Actinomadura parmotrematis]